MTRAGHSPAVRTRLRDLFVGFVGIGAMSFGGGLVAWIRREAVQRRGWMDDRQFLTSYGLCQIVPGANNVNLAVFIGSELRGVPGAIIAVVGLLLPPIAFYVAIGAIYLDAGGRSLRRGARPLPGRDGRRGHRSQHRHRLPHGTKEPEFCSRRDDRGRHRGLYRDYRRVVALGARRSDPHEPDSDLDHAQVMFCSSSPACSRCCRCLRSAGGRA